MSAPHTRRTATAPPTTGGGGAASGCGAAGLGSHSRTHSRSLSRSSSLALPATADASYAAAQELASVMNAPAASGGGWLAAAWPFAQSLVGEDYDAPPPPLPPGTLPEITMADFSRYLRSVGERLESLERTREASQQRMQEALSPEELRASQGQGLLAAMQEVPAPFFQEGFDLDQGRLWEELVQVGSEDARAESLDRLSGYLDVVEAHLVREIAARTDSFFDGSAYIQDVRGCALRLYEQVAALRKQVHGLEQEVGAAVATSQQLQQRRSNLTSTLGVLAAMEGVAQAQAALQGLLPRSGGVAVDYAGAMDVLEVLQGVLDDETLLALDCFKHLPGQIAETAQAVDDLMCEDLLERTRMPATGLLEGGILDRLRGQVAAYASTPRRRQRASSSSSLPSSRQLSAEEGAELEALAALPLSDGAAVERVAAWLERLAAGGSCGGSSGDAAAALASGFPDGGSGAAAAVADEGSAEALQEVLLPLVIGLRRLGRLPAVMKAFKEASAARLKTFLGHIVDGCLDILDPEGAPGDASHLLANRSVSPGRDTPTVAERLQRLAGQDFQWLLEAVVLAVRVSLHHCTEVGAAVQTILSAAAAPRQQLEAAAADARECCQAVAEAAAARWSRLLSGRAKGSSGGGGGGGGSGAARLAELKGVLELTDVLASLVEQYGVRGVLGLRSALQQLCKASLDGLHAKSLSKLTTLLEQEQWAVVEVHPQFQAIVDELQRRAATDGGSGGGGSGSRAQAAAAAEGGSSRLSADSEAAAAAAVEAVDGGGGDGAAAAAAAGPQPPVLRKFTITPHDGANGAAGGGANSPAATLAVGGQGYHVVNTQLLLLSTLRDYLAFRDAVPAFAAEVAQRVLELLKVFNSRTCQLVLGAGAMQVSGLKSITAKHLAISCQCLGAFMALQPALVALFTEGVAPPRRDMLAADFGRALQDYRIHHEEVCSKLVAIMRERLSANIRQLPALAAAWPSGGARPELPAPSSFATTAAKQLQILGGALSPIMLPAELHSVFGRIALMFSRTLAEAYELLEPHGAAWEQQLRADMQFLLNCLRSLPMEPSEREPNLERLTRLFEQRFVLRNPAGEAFRAPPPARVQPAQPQPVAAAAPAEPQPQPVAAAAPAEPQPQPAVAAAAPAEPQPQPQPVAAAAPAEPPVQAVAAEPAEPPAAPVEPGPQPAAAAAAAVEPAEAHPAAASPTAAEVAEPAAPVEAAAAAAAADVEEHEQAAPPEPARHQEHPLQQQQQPAAPAPTAAAAAAAGVEQQAEERPAAPLVHPP